MTLRLIFVRHGLSTFNKDHRIQGRNDLSTLTEQGKLQAIAAGKFLSTSPISRIYSSPLKRAAETTKGIVEQLQSSIIPIYTDDLLEIDLEAWSGLTRDEVKSKFPDAHEIWKQDPEQLEIKRLNGETYKPVKELMLQADSFIKKIIESHEQSTKENILVVGHNAILRCLILNLLNNPPQGFRKIQIDNASISIINIDKNNRDHRMNQLECLNSTNHLGTGIPNKKKKGRLILVRHGETDWNLEGRFQGQIDISLNHNGKKQASAAGDFLKNTLITKAFSSSMKRPQETAQIILDHHPNVKLKLLNDLVEISHGLWEGKLESEIKEKWTELLEIWKESPEKVTMPQGENLKEVWERSNKCWKEICESLEDRDTALVVAHDAVNKTILCNILGLTEKNIWAIKQGNGGITIIDFVSEGNQLITCFNLTSHLGGVFDTTASGAL